MFFPTTPHGIQVLMVLPNSNVVLWRISPSSHGTNHKANTKIEGFHMDSQMLRCMGYYQSKICGGSYHDCPPLGQRLVPCAHGCIQLSNMGNIGPKY
jgi:hypothetical protein